MTSFLFSFPSLTFPFLFFPSLYCPFFSFSSFPVLFALLSIPFFLVLVLLVACLFVNLWVVPLPTVVWSSQVSVDSLVHWHCGAPAPALSCRMSPPYPACPNGGKERLEIRSTVTQSSHSLSVKEIHRRGKSKSNTIPLFLIISKQWLMTQPNVFSCVSFASLHYAGPMLPHKHHSRT